MPSQPLSAYLNVHSHRESFFGKTSSSVFFISRASSSLTLDFVHRSPTFEKHHRFLRRRNVFLKTPPPRSGCKAPRLEVAETSDPAWFLEARHPRSRPNLNLAWNLEQGKTTVPPLVPLRARAMTELKPVVFNLILICDDQTRY